MAGLTKKNRTKSKGRLARMSFNETLQGYKYEYLAEAKKELATTKELAEWALRTGRWEPPVDLVLRKCREDFSKALREEYIKDSVGQPVRVNQAARNRVGDEQLTFWGDIRTAPRKHIEAAFTQRREQIVGECRQLDRDQRYYNSNHQTQPAIQTEFDFTDDVIEGRFSGEL